MYFAFFREGWDGGFGFWGGGKGGKKKNRGPAATRTDGNLCLGGGCHSPFRESCDRRDTERSPRDEKPVEAAARHLNSGPRPETSRSVGHHRLSQRFRLLAGHPDQVGHSLAQHH